MKKIHLLALSLAGVLAIPAVAQQNPPQNSPSSSSSQTQVSPPAQPPAAPASQSVNDQQNLQSNQQAAATGATGKEPLKVETREGFWGHLNPFARKKYVQRQIQPVSDRVNELDELTASNTRMIKDVDTRATEGIRVATLKANEADQHAVDAGNRANVAQQTAQQATTHLQSVESAVNNIDQYKSENEVEIRFRPGQTVLSKRAKDALDDIAEQMKGKNGYIVEVQGFSSGSGLAAVENSQKMAQAVVRYFVINHEVPVYRVYTVGMGNAPVQTEDGGTRRTRGGRVEVALLKNGAADLGSTNASAAPSSMGTSNQGGVSGNTQWQPTGNQQQQQPASTAAPANDQSQPPKR
jgi:outer membrane protein OmpA-like peptidoglycan-associated protein